jgi:hypothetical protein
MRSGMVHEYEVEMATSKSLTVYHHAFPELDILRRGDNIGISIYLPELLANAVLMSRMSMLIVDRASMSDNLWQSTPSTRWQRSDSGSLLNFAVQSPCCFWWSSGGQGCFRRARKLLFGMQSRALAISFTG